MDLVKVRLTYQDYILFPENGNRHELIDGDHYMAPAPVYKHQKISREIERQFANYFFKKKEGEILNAPFDVYLSDFDVVQPDIVIIKKGNFSIIKEKYIKGAPDIIIEILSPSTKENDLVLKKHLYEKHGVKEYWIVDPDKEEVHQFELRERKYILISVYAKSIESPLFHGLIIDLTKVF